MKAYPFLPILINFDVFNKLSKLKSSATTPFLSSVCFAIVTTICPFPFALYGSVTTIPPCFATASLYQERSVGS